MWGKQQGQPVLALHGMFDNAASFDKLIPLLDLQRPVLAIDIPGYGKSTNPPPGLSPNFLEIITWLRYLIKFHFNWDKVTLVGHSFGSCLGFIYSALYPSEVEKYISIDCAKVNMAIKPEYLMDDLRKGYAGGVVKTLGILREGTYQEFLDYMSTTRQKAKLPLTKEQCELLLSRDLEKIGENRYKTLVDSRPNLKYIGRPSLEFLAALSKNVKCEVLTIRASNGILVNERLRVYNQHIDNMKKSCSRLIEETVFGGHHVHLDNPGGVADVINSFYK